MPRPLSAFVAERNAKIIAAYQGDLTLSVEQIRDQLAPGLELETVRRIIKNRFGTCRKAPPTPTHAKRPINNGTRAFGERLHQERVKRGLSVIEFAAMLGLSEVNYAKSVQGLYDWPLTDLTRAMRVLDIPIEDLAQKYLPPFMR